MNPRNFFAELKRRNVYKVAIAYGVVGWLLIQVSDTVFPRLNLPDWAVTLVIALVLLGFPVAVVLAWAFELTPEGVVRAEDVAPNKSITRKTGRKLTVVIVLVGTVAAALFAFQSLRPKGSSTARGAVAPTPEKSIAVLPFENASGNPDAEYLSDGISEALINSLTELQQLKVIARSTAFRYKGKQIDPQAVGRELAVRTVLMGLVRQAGDRLNVQVDLVDATTGAQLWGQEYERKVVDVLSIKQTLVREVTEKLRLKLTGEQRHTLAKRDTTNAEAYQFYLRGRYYWNKRTAEGLKKALQEFQQAIDRDPGYALGYVGLADSYLLLVDYAGVPSSETLPKAQAAVERALQLDDSLAEAHTSLARIYSGQWRWAECEQEFRRGIALNPNYPTAHHWFSTYFRYKGQLDDALSESNRAYELDPLSPVIGANRANIFLQKNDFSSAVTQVQRVIELNPHFPNAHDNLGWIFLKQRRFEEAIAEFQQAVEFSGRDGLVLCDLGYGYAVAGRREEAIAILKELEARYARRETAGMAVAGVYVGLGELNQTFAWLEKDFAKRSALLPDVTYWTNFDDIRSDPRYADLLRRIGLRP